jgi:flagellar hook-length control protein FliK
MARQLHLTGKKCFEDDPMPAITTSANAIASISPPGPRTPGNASPDSNDTSGRPFAAVLKEKVGAPSESKRENKTADEGDSNQTTDSTAAKGEEGVASQWVVNGIQNPAQPASDADLTGVGDVQSPTKAIADALLAGAGLRVNSVGPASTQSAAEIEASQFDSKTIAGLTTNSPTAVENAVGANAAGTFEQAVSDIRFAMSRAASGTESGSHEAGGSPAKNAASLAVVALETESQTSQGNRAGDQVNLLLESNGTVPTISAHTSDTTSSIGRNAEFRIGTSMGTNHWETAIGNSLVVMSGTHQNRAELVLTPPQLGRIEVSLSMRGDDASLSFVSSNPAVREALENALPRLKEILADAGISLGQTQVGSESPGQTAKDSQNRDNSRSNAISDLAIGETLQQDSASRGSSALRRVTLALVDTYA